jgi:hypothetical protein
MADEARVLVELFGPDGRPAAADACTAFPSAFRDVTAEEPVTQAAKNIFSITASCKDEFLKDMREKDDLTLGRMFKGCTLTVRDTCKFRTPRNSA